MMRLKSSLLAVGLHDDERRCSRRRSALQGRGGCGARHEEARPCARVPQDSDAIEQNERARRAFGVKDYETAIKEYTAAGLEDSAPLIV